MADYTPVFLPGTAYTSQASAAITGGQLVEVTGNGTVGPAALNSVKVVGVAAHDQPTVGGKVTLILNKPVHETTASGAITAGDSLAPAASGLVVTGAAATLAAAGTRVGIAITTAAGAALVRWIAL